MKITIFASTINIPFSEGAKSPSRLTAQQLRTTLYNLYFLASICWFVYNTIVNRKENKSNCLAGRDKGHCDGYLLFTLAQYEVVVTRLLLIVLNAIPTISAMYIMKTNGV